MSLGQVVLIGLGKGERVCIHSQLGKQDLKSAHHHFLTGHGAFFQPLPAADIDVVVDLQQSFIRLYAELPEGLVETDPLRFVEIQNGIIQI